MVYHRSASTLRLKNCTVGREDLGNAILTLDVAAPSTSKLYMDGCIVYNAVSVQSALHTLSLMNTTFNVSFASKWGAWDAASISSIANLAMKNNTINVTGSTSGAFFFYGTIGAGWDISDNTVNVSVDDPLSPGLLCGIGNDGSTPYNYGGVDRLQGAGVFARNKVYILGTSGQHSILLGAGLAASTVEDNVIAWNPLFVHHDGADFGFVVKSTGHTIRGNYVMCPKPLLLKSAAQNNLISHNTFVALAGYAVSFLPTTTYLPTGNVLRDNILSAVGLPVFSGNLPTGTVVDNNLYVPEFTTFGTVNEETYSTLSQFAEAWETFNPEDYAQCVGVPVGIGGDPGFLSTDPESADFLHVDRTSIVRRASSTPTTTGAHEIGAYQLPGRSVMLGGKLLWGAQ